MEVRSRMTLFSSELGYLPEDESSVVEVELELADDLPLACLAKNPPDFDSPRRSPMTGSTRSCTSCRVLSARKARFFCFF